MELLINLTVNGLATGMLIFLLASGLTLIFGLMSVLNFAHGGLVRLGSIFRHLVLRTYQEVFSSEF